MQRSLVVSRSLSKAFRNQQRFNSAAPYQYILTEVKGNVGVITLNRPKALNALCNDLINEVVAAGKKFDLDDNVGAIVLTGSEKAFAAGADIKEMATKTYAETYGTNMFANWGDVAKLSKPVSSPETPCVLAQSHYSSFACFHFFKVIAAVSGYALGGGCELAMTCDIIIASESAKFGQPEITLGVIPGKISPLVFGSILFVVI